MGSEPLFPLHHRWEVMPLGEVCRRGGGNVQTGPFGSQLHASDYVSDGIPSVMPQNIGDNKILYTGIAKITREDAERLSKYRMREGDIVYSRRGDVERRALVRKTEDGWLCGTGCLRIRFGDEFVYPRYAAHYLGHPSVREWIVRHAHGATMPNLNTTILSELPFVLPPWSAQVLIGDAIEAYDRKLDLNRRINQTLEAMAQAIFQSWFVNFDPVKAKVAAIQEGRDPLRATMSAISGKPDAELDSLPREQFEQLAATAALFTDEMKESELGAIPKGWSVSKVETLLARLSAKVRYTKEQVSEHGQIPVFEQGASILLGYHNGAATYQASAENPKFIFGDHTCVTRLSCQPFDISQNVIPLQGQDRATAWVYYAVKEKQKFQEYRRHWMELISKDVVVAPADACLEFSKIISGIHLQMEANERQMQGLAELRDTLLPKLLSGELSLSNVMAEVEA